MAGGQDQDGPHIGSQTQDAEEEQEPPLLDLVPPG